MSEKKWYRVSDTLNPLHGCDVTGREKNVGHSDGTMTEMFVITALRRVDIFVGDRPFQLVAKDGEYLGLLVDKAHLVDSPFQDEIMEVGDDRPFGICLDESEMTREDGVMLRVARYEKAVQIALSGADGKLRATNTQTDDLRYAWEQLIVGMFERNDDEDDIAYALRNN